MCDNPRLEAALRIAALGWPVFRLGPDSKRPLPYTHGVKDATTDAETVRRWWTESPACNIGIACGGERGPLVVDLDVPGAGGHKADGAKSLAAAGIEIPATPLVAVTPSGGTHCYYSKPADGSDVRNGANVRGLDGVDVRSAGGYVVAPGSVVNGRPYTWRDGVPDGFSPSDLPPFPASLLRRTDAEQEGAEQEPPPLFPWSRPTASAFPWATRPLGEGADHAGAKAPATAAGPTPAERARDYLATMDPATQGAGGHNALLRAATALVVGFRLGEAEALRLLWDEYNPRCSPPWDPSSRKDVRDFERKVSEAARNLGNRTPGWLLDATLPEFAPDAALEAVGGSFAAAVASGAGTDADAAGAGGPASTCEAVEAVPESDPYGAEVADVPDGILHLPGLAGEVAGWILERARMPQPLFANGAALAMLGALMGRKVATDYGARSGLYALLVGESSTGKGWPQEAAKLLASKAGSRFGVELLDEVTSDSALVAALRRSPSVMLGMDEVGHFFEQARRAETTGGALGTVPKALMKLWSATSGTFVGKARLGRDGEAAHVEAVDQPCVSLLAATTPAKLFDGMTRAQIEDGFVPRLLVFPALGRPVYRDVPTGDPPPELVAKLAAWRDFKPPPPRGVGNLAAATTHKPAVVPVSRDALDVLGALRAEADRRRAEGERRGEASAAMWGKAAEQAERIALVLGAGRTSPGDPSACVSGADARTACDLVRWLLADVSRRIGENVAESKAEAEKLRVLRVIRSAGKRGIQKRALTRATQFVRDVRTRDAMLADLVQAGRVEVAKVKKPTGPETVLYVAT